MNAQHDAQNSFAVFQQTLILIEISADVLLFVANVNAILNVRENVMEKTTKTSLNVSSSLNVNEMMKPTSNVFVTFCGSAFDALYKMQSFLSQY